MCPATIPLREIEVVQRVAGTTSNDVVLAIVAGAMHRWHTSRGHDVIHTRMQHVKQDRRASLHPALARFVRLSREQPHAADACSA